MSNYSFTTIGVTESTNNYAMAMVHAGLAKHGDAFFSSLQTNGKGQRGKHWQSGNGENIALSIIIEPLTLKINQQFNLSMAVAFACHSIFSKYAGDLTTIKWPNDIYWSDRKAAGILIENIIGQSTFIQNETTWKYAVVGIGVNINQTQFDTALLNPVSLKQITGKIFDIVEIAKELHLEVVIEIEKILNENFEEIFNNYNKKLYKKNCRVRLKKDNIVFETTIKSVSTNGQLLTSDLIDNQFDFGQVEWILE